MRGISVASRPRPMMFDMSNLPQPSEAFDWVQAAAGPALICRPLASLAPHIFTTRRWPLGSTTAGGDDPAPWDDVARAVHVEPARLVRVRQVHGADVVIAEDVRWPPSGGRYHPVRRSHDRPGRPGGRLHSAAPRRSQYGRRGWRACRMAWPCRRRTCRGGCVAHPEIRRPFRRSRRGDRPGRRRLLL